MKKKLKADANDLDTKELQIEYVMNQVDGLAFYHLKLKKKNNAPKPWTITDNMFAYLKKVFGDSHCKKNAKANFQNLYQDQKDFFTFYTKFQQLLIELEWNDITLISNLTSKLFLEIQTQLNTSEKPPQNLTKYTKQCSCVYQRLKDTARVKAAVD